MRETIKTTGRAIKSVYQRVYYKLFDSYAYHCYYNKEEAISREIVAQNFIEFDEDSFKNMPTYTTAD